MTLARACTTILPEKNVDSIDRTHSWSTIFTTKCPTINVFFVKLVSRCPCRYFDRINPGKHTGRCDTNSAQLNGILQVPRAQPAKPRLLNRWETESRFAFTAFEEFKNAEQEARCCCHGSDVAGERQAFDAAEHISEIDNDTAGQPISQESIVEASVGPAQTHEEAIQSEFAAIQAAADAGAGQRAPSGINSALSSNKKATATSRQAVSRVKPKRTRRRVSKQRTRAGYSTSNANLTEAEQRKLKTAEGIKNSRWLPDSAFPRVFGKPPFHAYGWGNTDPIADANYLSSFNVAPLLHEANDKAEAQMEKVNFVYDSAVLHADPERYHQRLAQAARLEDSGVDPEEPLLLDTAKEVLAHEYSEHYEANKAFRKAARGASVAVPKAGATAKEVKAARAAAAAKLQALKRQRWEKEHPGEPFPDDVQAEEAKTAAAGEETVWGLPGGILPAALTHSMPLPAPPVNRKPVGILPTLPATVPTRKRGKGRSGAAASALEARRAQRQQARSQAHSTYAAGSTAAKDTNVAKREWFESKAHDGKWVSTAALSQELTGLTAGATDAHTLQQRQAAATSILAKVPVSARRSFSAGVHDSMVWWPNMQGAPEHKCQVRPPPPAATPSDTSPAPSERDVTRSNPNSAAQSVVDTGAAAPLGVYRTAEGDLVAIPTSVSTAQGARPAAVLAEHQGKPPCMRSAELSTTSQVANGHAGACLNCPVCSQKYHSAAPQASAPNSTAQHVQTTIFHPKQASRENPREYKHLPAKYTANIRPAGLVQKPSLHAADAFSMYD